MRLLVDGRIRFSLCSVVMSVVLAGCIGANAQLTAAAGGVSKPQSPAAGTAVRNSSSRDSDSIISEDDVLDVYVMDIAELSRQYRVSPSGDVVLPLLPNPLPAAGMTLSQFSDALAQQLRTNGLVTNPHIVVTIVSSRLKSIAVTGAVKMPQIYPVFGRTTLLDVLSQAQGLSDDASNVAVISRGDLGAEATNSAERSQTVDVKKLLQTGDPKYNVELFPGDRVTIPRAGVVYVVGAVNKPGGFTIRSSGNGMTVLQSLALAEGLNSTAKRSKAMIIRPDSNNPKNHEQLPLNLNSVLAGKKPDPLLLADDILFIPDSTAKRAFRRGAEAAVQASTYLVIYRP